MRYLFVLSLLFVQIYAHKANHLLGQTSPYLKQHLYNPIDWYPWSKKAFLKAKKEHKMIFLSIGYSTCHWCHVMEKESFNDTDIAKLLNKYFVSIEVDKEELPQVDKKYQRIYQKLFHKKGGWPLNLFLTEDLKPFYIAKYIPKNAAYSSPGLITLLKRFSYTYVHHKKDIYTLAKKIEKQETMKMKVISHTQNSIIKSAVAHIKKSFDKKYKGFGKSAKYPESSKIDLLLDYGKVYDDKKSLYMALQTLKAMQKSSIYDVISGGFFRYTTDREWNSPHFEKMLYSNAQILSSYIKAYKMTKNRDFKTTVIKSIYEFDKHFTDKKGLYFSASDANSNGLEGGYYIFKSDDLLQKLILQGIQKNDAKKALKYLDITEDGNYDSEYALPHITNLKKPKNFEKILHKICLIKEKRKFPFLDKKVITSWNAMMIKTKLQASYINPTFKNEALKSLKNLLLLMQKSNGSLYHQTIDGKMPTQEGVLEDYAYLCDTLIIAYEKTFNKAYLNKAITLTHLSIDKFYKNGSWYLSSDKLTKADGDDSYYTSALSVMLKDILSIATIKSSLKLQDVFDKTISSFKYQMINNSKNYAQMVDDLLRYKKGIIVIKSSKKNLIKYQKEIENINYPFLLEEAINSKQFLSCDLKSCFGYGDFKTVKQKVVSKISTTP